MYQPIENYGVIGNARTVALVGMHGSIDWFCYPDVDSPSVFGALLDDQKGGRFSILPAEDSVRRKQFYWPSTNILVTRFFNEQGIAELQDFMPMRTGASPSDSVYRRALCVRGEVRFQVECTPAFDYGRQSHTVDFCRHGARFQSPGLTMRLSSTVPLREGACQGAIAEFVLKQGETALFVLSGCESCDDPSEPPNENEAQFIFHETVKYWRQWLSACSYHGRWREQVQRSALLLKLLTYRPTGAIVAAPTCSLPEVIGGIRNWDYRYTWIRDAAFTVYAFLRLGFKEEAAGFIEWLTRFPPRSEEQGYRPHPADRARRASGPRGDTKSLGRLPRLLAGPHRQRRGRSIPERYLWRGHGFVLLIQ